MMGRKAIDAYIPGIWKLHPSLQSINGRFLLKSALLTTVFVFFVLASFASAQQGDAMFGFGTVISSKSNSASLATPQAEDGGLYPSFSADVIFKHHIGFNGEVSWRASRATYVVNGPVGFQDQPYRPILFDFNAVYQPRITKKAGADLMAGVGWQNTRFYVPFCTNGFTCNPFVTSNHFLLHLGGGVRYYVWSHVFFRPEVHYYRINNNNDFNSDNIFRVGASIGYTIGPE
jgi:opacity protein-like surface antigen